MAKLYLWLAIGAALQLTAHANNAGPSAGKGNSKAVCTTSQCVLTAADILRDMQPTADPCVDFSEFVCGGFRERHEIPPEDSSIGYFHLLAQENDRIVKGIVTRGDPKSAKAPASDAAAQRNIDKMQDTFESCMNEEQMIKIGRQPLVDEVQNVLAIFPVSDSMLTATEVSLDGNVHATLAEGDRKNLSLAMAHFIKNGMDAPIGFSVGADLKTPEKNVLGLNEGGLGMPSKELYSDETLMSAYEQTIGQMLTLILGKEHEQPGTPPQVTEEWAAVAKDIVAFEKELAAASTSFGDLNDLSKVYNPATVAELANATTMVDWPLMFQQALPPNVKVPEPIIVSSPPYLTKLNDLLKKTAPKTLQNYFAWNVIRQRAGSLGEPYQQPTRNLNALLSGTNPNVVGDRWKACVGVVNDNVGEIAGHYFLQEAFTGQSRSSVENMINSIRGTYTKSFPQYSWLDKITLKGALQKIKAIIQKVGASTDSPDVASTASLDEYYKDLKVEKDAFFANQVRVAQWSTAKSLEELNKPANKKKMDMVPQTVNAYYNPSVNEIVFPAGILQPPFFHVGNPDYINYGGIGVVIGHELTHGFDNQGHLFDSTGRMVDWWTNSTTASFNQKAQCFVDQFNNFTIKGADGKDHHVDGKLTLGENLADAGGLKKAFETWQAQSKKAGGRKATKKVNNQRLPGLEKMTPEQLYFVTYARLWCNKARPEAELQRLLTDVHSPAQWRINGAVQNSPYFAKAFKCPANSPMNPTKKCEIW